MKTGRPSGQSDHSEGSAGSLRIGIVASTFTPDISRVLVDRAHQTLQSLGVADDAITVEWVPGAFETPIAARWLADDGHDAVITLGAIIRGETHHFEEVSRAAADGALRVALSSGVPVVFGVLTTYDADQAAYRAAPDGLDKGAEAARVAVGMGHLRQLRGTPPAR